MYRALLDPSHLIMNTCTALMFFVATQPNTESYATQETNNSLEIRFYANVSHKDIKHCSTMSR